MQEQLDKDLKEAMLSRDKAKVETIKGLKNALQYEAVNQRVKPEDLTDEHIQKVLAREAKKRQEAADLYKQGGSEEKAQAELSEKAIIDAYLPEQVGEEQIIAAIREELAKIDSPTPADMGRIIGAVKGKLGAGADGSTIARLVKQALENK